MKRFFAVFIIAFIPLVMMLQVLQSYRYVSLINTQRSYEKLQQDKFEENKRLLAGIAVFDAPERVYGISTESLGLNRVNPDKILLVEFLGNSERSSR